MNTLMEVAASYPAAGGLGGLVDWLMGDWIRPAFIGLVAAIAVFLLVKKSFRMLIGFAGVAIVAGLFIFAGNDLFGSKDSGLTGIAKKGVDKLNTVDLANSTYAPQYLTDLE